METEKITNLEKEVIQNIINSEYMDAQGEQMINWAVWSFSVTNQTKQLAGALGSLVKKGLCGVDNTEKDPACWLTQKGYNLAKNNGII